MDYYDLRSHFARRIEELEKTLRDMKANSRTKSDVYKITLKTLETNKNMLRNLLERKEMMRQDGYYH